VPNLPKNIKSVFVVSLGNFVVTDTNDVYFWGIFPDMTGKNNRTLPTHIKFINKMENDIIHDIKGYDSYFDVLWNSGHKQKIEWTALICFMFSQLV